METCTRIQKDTQGEEGFPVQMVPWTQKRVLITLIS